ncbi:recombinase family protein [Robertmurraya korlensis]|uniref:recombinase family protein n=1 Tax=Robertmurraya korlensis TaxID=519977 RepID=UPI00203B778C|nr:recombinase family protein [Robertmurraya korlensis]MCM3599354.1 recombinase family protein [Robertmurraya korlensis]
MAVGIYIRVSTEEQAQEGYSIAAQRERLVAFCLSQGWSDYRFYVDEGLSAKDTNRTQLQLMIDHIQQGSISVVLVYKLDRLTRSVLDLYKLLDTFEQYGCKFKSATEVYDTSTAMGRLFLTLVAALAQWERENLGERVRMGQIEKARQGEYAAKAPFGFDKGNDHRLVINKNEAEIILKMVNKLREGYSIRQLSNYLNDSGIDPIRGYKWHIRTILDILHNPAIYGAVQWLDELTENAHEGIVSKNEFEEIQKVLADRKNVKKRETYSTFIFQMKLICPVCGNHLSAERSKYTRKKTNERVEVNGYRCQPCTLNKRGSVRVSEKRVEKGFVKFMNGLILNKDNLPQTKEPEPDTTDSELQKVLHQIKQVERQREKYQRAWSTDLISDDEFSERMKETKKVLNELMEKQKSIAPPETKKNEVDPEKILAIVKEFELNWLYLNDQEKKQFLTMFIDKIIFQKEENLDVTVLDVHFF